jgi:hypothetical protein
VDRRNDPRMRIRIGVPLQRRRPAADHGSISPYDLAFEIADDFIGDSLLVKLGESLADFKSKPFRRNFLKRGEIDV